MLAQFVNHAMNSRINPLTSSTVPLGEFFITTGWDISELVEQHESLSRDKRNLQKQIQFEIELERKVRERTAALEVANQELSDSVRALRREISDRDAGHHENVVKISELLLKQSDLLQSNAKILRVLHDTQEDNLRLRNKLMFE